MVGDKKIFVFNEFESECVIKSDNKWFTVVTLTGDLIPGLENRTICIQKPYDNHKKFKPLNK